MATQVWVGLLCVCLRISRSTSVNFHHKIILFCLTKFLIGYPILTPLLCTNICHLRRLSILCMRVEDHLFIRSMYRSVQDNAPTLWTLMLFSGLRFLIDLFPPINTPPYKYFSKAADHIAFKFDMNILSAREATPNCYWPVILISYLTKINN